MDRYIADRYILEKVKITGLKYHYNNFDKKADISDKGKKEILWCIGNIGIESHHIVTLNFDTGIYADASLTGWGIVDIIHPSRSL